VTAFSPTTYALTQSFTSDPSVTTVGATANFTTNNGGTITLTLTDTLHNPPSLAQLLSDISFSVSGGGAVTTPSVSALATSNLIGLTDGSSSQTHTTGTGNPWTLSSSGGGYLVTALVGSNKTLIIGPIDSPSTFCIPKCPDGLGNSNFNPFFDQSATFTLGIAGVTALSTISDVVFSFGTGPETVVGIPIPAAVWLFGSGLIGLVGVARRKLAADPLPA